MRPQALVAKSATPARTAHSRPTPPTTRLADDFTAASTRFDISAQLTTALAWQESHFAMSSTSPKGAIGIMQLMPGTAKELGVDPQVPTANIEGGAEYLKMMMDRYDGDLVRALAAYNAGPNAVDRSGGVPPYRETQDYVNAILDQLAAAALSGQPLR
jgi:soluble lytic murein transglycosylase-like protein